MAAGDAGAWVPSSPGRWLSSSAALAVINLPSCCFRPPKAAAAAAAAAGRLCLVPRPLRGHGSSVMPGDIFSGDCGEPRLLSFFATACIVRAACSNAPLRRKSGKDECRGAAACAHDGGNPAEHPPASRIPTPPGTGWCGCNRWRGDRWLQRGVTKCQGRCAGNLRCARGVREVVKGSSRMPWPGPACLGHRSVFCSQCRRP